MPRENSFSDEGRSITPDLDDRDAMDDSTSPPQSPVSPVAAVPPPPATLHTVTSAPGAFGSPPTPDRPTVRPTFVSAPVDQFRTLTPGDRFRSSVRKIIHMHRASSFMSPRGNVGAEPGADPRRESAFINYGHIRQNCVIEVADYSSVRSSFGRMTNRELVDLMNDARASEREPWVKVRWINVGGISWDVISAISIKYDLHPLAVEDVLHQRPTARSKSDYYPKHLFLRILCHTLADPDDVAATASISAGVPTFTELPRSASPTPMNEVELEKLGIDGLLNSSVEADEKTVFGSAPVSRFSTKRGLRHGGKEDVEAAPERKGQPSRLGMLRMAARRERARDAITIEELKKGERVNVQIKPMSIFLMRDGTVISFHPDPNLEFTAAIMERLRRRDTVLRTSADPSLLVQSLLDLIVDQTLEVVDEYQGKILKLEHDILLRPKMKTVRYLHILSGDLTLHKRTLQPIRTVIYGLRRYDLDRAAAQVDMSKAPPGYKPEGFISHKANIYLADVLDHMEYILSSLDMFASISENLINYTFNIVSYEMNEVMRRLTLATIIFLPLTLLTGYFGMNFDNMWSIHHNHTDVVFWIIALPLMSIVLTAFMYPDFVRAWHYIQKKSALGYVLARYKQE